MWERLPKAIQDRVDSRLSKRRTIQAIKLVYDEGGLHPKPSLPEVQDLVTRRLAQLTETGLADPPPTVRAAELMAAAKALPDPLAAIEASWDGDTTGWMVTLSAIVRRPGRHHTRYDEVTLANIRDGDDLRLFNDTVPPWPETGQATRTGRAVAAELGVPFHFPQPHTPDHTRWWDTAP